MSHDPYGAFVDRAADAGSSEGALAGVRVGIKANIAVKGLPWTAGMSIRRDVIAERDADVVLRLREAGAAILGTHNMHEAALGSTTDNPFYGRTVNPHREGFTPGGSSGGSGAAVAVGLCDLALGTDTLGSVRIPAAYCGVYGLKPTSGAVPQGGLVALDERLDVIGPLARDLDLLEAAWRVIADEPGHSVQFRRALTLADLAGVVVDPWLRDAWRRALDAVGLARASIDLPATLDRIRLSAFAGIGRAIAGALGPDIPSVGLSKELRVVIDAALGMPFDGDLLARTKAALTDALGTDGVLILPTAPQVAFAHTRRPPASQPLFTGLANVAGLPALACPAGRDPHGLPLSVQLIGPPGSEPGLIDLARRIEPALGGFVSPPAFQGEPQCA